MVVMVVLVIERERKIAIVNWLYHLVVQCLRILQRDPFQFGRQVHIPVTWSQVSVPLVIHSQGLEQAGPYCLFGQVVLQIGPM